MLFPLYLSTVYLWWLNVCYKDNFEIWAILVRTKKLLNLISLSILCMLFRAPFVLCQCLMSLWLEGKHCPILSWCYAFSLYMTYCIAKDNNCCSCLIVWLYFAVVIMCLCTCVYIVWVAYVDVTMSMCMLGLLTGCPSMFSNGINVFFFLSLIVWFLRLSFLSTAFGSKTSVSYNFCLLGLCLPSTILVQAHLVYIRYLFCFSPHCNKPKCCTVHLTNTLRNGRDHSRISPLSSPWQPSDSFLPPSSYSSLSLLYLFANSLFIFNL